MSARIEETYDSLRGEHDQLRELVDRLKSHHTIIGLAPLLEKFHNALIQHFSHEQFPGGFYETMGAFGPEYHDDLRHLVKEHCTMLSAVGALIERTRHSEHGDEAALLQDMHTVLQQLGEHEKREHELAAKLIERQQK
jgi:hypothetical protein